MGVIEFLFALAQDMILAAIPAVGFAMVFNVPEWMNGVRLSLIHI